MRAAPVIAVCFVAVLCSCATTQPLDQRAGPPLPPDMVAFLERRVLCEHFLQEDPYDAERREFLVRSIDATCTGTDAALRALRERYRNDPQIDAQLAEFEYPLGH